MSQLTETLEHNQQIRGDVRATWHQVWTSPAVQAQIKADLSVLTPRELEVLTLIASSYSTKQIAAELGVAFKTVVTHRTHLMKKLDLHDTAGITRYAIRHGLVQP